MKNVLKNLLLINSLVVCMNVYLAANPLHQLYDLHRYEMSNDAKSYDQNDSLIFCEPGAIFHRSQIELYSNGYNAYSNVFSIISGVPMYNLTSPYYALRYHLTTLTFDKFNLGLYACITNMSQEQSVNNRITVQEYGLSITRFLHNRIYLLVNLGGGVGTLSNSESSNEYRNVSRYGAASSGVSYFFLDDISVNLELRFMYLESHGSAMNIALSSSYAF